MAVTIKDIARICNVSYSTVSRVLNGKAVRQNAKTEKILATAKALGYNPNHLAIQLVKSRTNMLGLLIPDVANPHYSEITKLVEDAAHALGYQVFLCNTDWDVCKEVMYRNSLMEQRVAGIIVMPVGNVSHAIFRGLDIPVVLFGTRTEEPGLSCVVMDNASAVEMATEHLLANGFRDLVFICRKLINYTTADRMEGFKATLKKHGIAVTEDSILQSDSHWMDGGYSATKQLLKRKRPPNGIVAYNDFVAIGAIQALSEAGVEVGREMGVVGFDNILFSALHTIELSTITPDNAALAKKALDIIRATSNDGYTGHETFVYPPKMFVRRSSGANLG